jgi:hypothetical protein
VTEVAAEADESPPGFEPAAELCYGSGMQFSPVFRYLMVPLRIAPLLLIVTFSVLFLIVMFAGLFGIPLGIILLAGFINYSFILLTAVTAGIDEPPVLTIENLNPVDARRSLTLLAIVVSVFFLSDAAAYWFGPIVAGLLGMLALIILPAVIAMQGVTGSLLQSLNLVRCFRLMLRLRGDYLQIIAWVGWFAMLGYVIFGTLAGSMVPLIVRFAFLMYAWLATFTLIGGVLRERRLDLGLDDANTPEWMEPETVDFSEVEKRRDRQVDAIYAEWRGGARVNAWASVSKLVEQSADPILELEWLYDRISQWPEPYLANRLAQELLPRLFAAKRPGDALDITRERLKAYADFRPLQGDDLIRLARLANDAGDRPAARAMLHNFQRFFPDDPLQPVAAELQQQLAR